MKYRDTGPSRRYPPANVCIYCGSTENLTDEHIIPFALGGRVVLPKASCRKCQRVTADFEQTVCRRMMGPLRARLNLQTRRPKERPADFVLKGTNHNGLPASWSVPAARVPTALMGIILDPATFPLDLPPTGRVQGDIISKPTDGDAPSGKAVIAEFQMEAFCRMIAKIGHAHVMAALANEGTPIPKIKDLFLPDIILGTSPHFQHYVGGEPLAPETPNAMHQLRFNRAIFHERKLLVSSIRLFSLFGMPTYHVFACYEPPKPA